MTLPSLTFLHLVYLVGSNVDGRQFPKAAADRLNSLTGAHSYPACSGEVALVAVIGLAPGRRRSASSLIELLTGHCVTLLGWQFASRLSRHKSATWSHPVPHEQITLRTQDGDCPTHVMTPEGEGPWAAAVMYMDAGGIRPAMLDMAQRLADAGYVVLLPDLFYRYGRYGPFVPAEVLKGDMRAILGPLMATTGPDKAAEDTWSLLDYLGTRKDVDRPQVGLVGFCMGGGMAIAAAAAFPDRITAVASFHGGNLATDAPTSPHRGAPQLKAEVYIAAAENETSYPLKMAEQFEDALTEAGVRFRTETYPAAHGWMMPDFPVYDHEAAERGWSQLAALFQSALH